MAGDGGRWREMAGNGAPRVERAVRIVVSAIGEQMLPKIEPPSVAPRHLAAASGHVCRRGVVLRSRSRRFISAHFCMNGIEPAETDAASGPTSGKRMAIVPNAEPVLGEPFRSCCAWWI